MARMTGMDNVAQLFPSAAPASRPRMCGSPRRWSSPPPSRSKKSAIAQRLSHGADVDGGDG